MPSNMYFPPYSKRFKLNEEQAPLRGACQEATLFDVATVIARSLILGRSLPGLNPIVAHKVDRLRSMRMQDSCLLNQQIGIDCQLVSRDEFLGARQHQKAKRRQKLPANRPRGIDPQARSSRVLSDEESRHSVPA